MSGDFLSVDTYDFLFILSHMNNIKTLNNEIIEASGGTGGETVLFQRARLTRLSKELGVFCQLQDVSSANCRTYHLPTAGCVSSQLQDVSAANCSVSAESSANCRMCQLTGSTARSSPDDRCFGIAAPGCAGVVQNRRAGSENTPPVSSQMPRNGPSFSDPHHDRPSAPNAA